ncbi:hypothetical protein E1A91_A12G110100v1 [Gossypium mustelinum]|uniref:Secreted protein n=3 Tax=Gossypium TaxID=3633 RepID=A0A5J5TC60_GOSBA|nr:hypothetical protein ES319_A12G108500v1 [Gossypium barbadense]TYG89652.1 hypothetical protein ES288_A12G117200v1 [Gossypium darwinii]TYJ04698.1 hypothetical protein E1A91_A12G110100v1 [Gossypium mustelinum]
MDQGFSPFKLLPFLLLFFYRLKRSSSTATFEPNFDHSPVLRLWVQVTKKWRRNGRGACSKRAGADVQGGVRGICWWLRSCGA